MNNTSPATMMLNSPANPLHSSILGPKLRCRRASQNRGQAADLSKIFAVEWALLRARNADFPAIREKGALASHTPLPHPAGQFIKPAERWWPPSRLPPAGRECREGPGRARCRLDHLISRVARIASCSANGPAIRRTGPPMCSLPASGSMPRASAAAISASTTPRGTGCG
jgi:hypothetical protein